MNVIYAVESLDELVPHKGESIFLAGPTPRDNVTPSWRPEALRILEEIKFGGTVLVPEDRSGVFKCSYDDQVEWEERGLQLADCIMFWVPRSLPHMPAFTTNDEWGTWKKSGKVVWGNPPDAVKVSYQRYYAQKLNVPMSDNLLSTCMLAKAKAWDVWLKREQLAEGVYI